ncbi:MAG: 6-phosphogluconolactonase [Actinomycetaceae bacterium]|nr:6-phosphogluconolactonase [Actinomycetaceae bacterium]
MMDLDLKVFKSPDELYAKAALALVRKLGEISEYRAQVQLGLSGGSVATKMLPKVADVMDSHPEAWQNWSPVNVWMVDERYVEFDSPDRSDSIIERELTSKFPIFNLHRPGTPSSTKSVEKAAEEYGQEMVDTYSTVRPIDPRSVALDVAILGMGPDGHFASLFPSHETLRHTGLITYEKDSPKPPPERISMTVPLLRRSRLSWFIISGGDKASVFAHALQGADFREVPAATMNQVGTTWWSDEEAASQIDRLI